MQRPPEHMYLRPMICLCGAVMFFFGAASGNRDSLTKGIRQPSRPFFSVTLKDSARDSTASTQTDKGGGARSQAGIDTGKSLIPSTEKKDTLFRTVQPVIGRTDSQQPARSQLSSAVKNGRRPLGGRPFGSLRLRLLLQAAVFLVSIFIIFLAVKFIARRSTPQRFLTTTRLSVMDKEVQRACRHIEKNFTDPDLSVTTVCAELVTGEAFLEALMERDLGISVNDFIGHVRVNNAKLLMEKNPLISGEDAAGQTGFTDPNAFRQTFKKITGTAFESYRDLRNKKKQ
jgi:AraC-like DNA-binding protein